MTWFSALGPASPYAQKPVFCFLVKPRSEVFRLQMKYWWTLEPQAAFSGLTGLSLTWHVAAAAWIETGQFNVNVSPRFLVPLEAHDPTMSWKMYSFSRLAYFHRHYRQYVPSPYSQPNPVSPMIFPPRFLSEHKAHSYEWKGLLYINEKELASQVNPYNRSGAQ